MVNRMNEQGHIGPVLESNVRDFEQQIDGRDHSGQCHQVGQRFGRVDVAMANKKCLLVSS